MMYFMDGPLEITHDYEKLFISVEPHKTWSSFDAIISKLLKCHPKAKRRTPAYSRALRPLSVVVQRGHL